MSEICQEKLWSAGAWSSHLCGKKGKVQHEGKWYCGMHSPEAKAKRKAVVDARWNRKQEAWTAAAQELAYNRKAGDVCRALGIVDPAELVTHWLKRSAI